MKVKERMQTSLLVHAFHTFMVICAHNSGIGQANESVTSLADILTDLSSTSANLMTSTLASTTDEDRLFQMRRNRER